MAFQSANRPSDEVEIWQIAGMDCNEDRERARQQGSAGMAFGAGYVIGGKDPLTRGVPPEHREGLLALVRSYSTRPVGAQNTQLVRDPGLFDYRSCRFSIGGTPDECFERAIAARAAGVRRLMLSVSVAVDPVAAVRLVWRASTAADSRRLELSGTPSCRLSARLVRVLTRA